MPRLDVPLRALFDPVLVQLFVLAGLDEVLHLHLLELAGAEDEVAGGDLVAEALAQLGDAERRLLAAAGHHVGEVEEDALGGLGPQVVQTGLVLDHAEVGLEHHVEVAGFGPRAAGAAVGAGEPVEVDRVGICDALLGRVVLLHVVGAIALVAGLALGQGVREGAQVAAGLPGLRGQDDAGVEADDVVARGDHRAPPLALDVLLELDTERAVVPGRPRAAVDLTTGIDETSALAEVDDIVECGCGWLGHDCAPRAGSAGWLPVVGLP